jgi:hypothetical protein
MPSTHPHALGLSDKAVVLSQRRLLTTGRYCTVVDDGQPVPQALSLSEDRLRHLEQGRVGTCWAHAAVQFGESSAKALGYDAFPICRQLVCWGGKQFEGGGNPAEGGSPIDAIESMIDGRGWGIAHENLLGYVDDPRALAMKPPPPVLADAKKSHIVAPVVVTSLTQGKKLIASKRGVCNGIWWPYGWDDSKTFMTTIGPGEYGHALLWMGYVEPGVFDDHAWLQLDNWHGLLYPPLKPDLARKVPGYRPIQPDRTSDFWVRQDTYLQVVQKGNAMHCSATDFAGINKGLVHKVSDFDPVFPL